MAPPLPSYHAVSGEAAVLGGPRLCQLADPHLHESQIACAVGPAREGLLERACRRTPASPPFRAATRIQGAGGAPTSTSADRRPHWSAVCWAVGPARAAVTEVVALPPPSLARAGGLKRAPVLPSCPHVSPGRLAWLAGPPPPRRARAKAGGQVRALLSWHRPSLPCGGNSRGAAPPPPQSFSQRGRGSHHGLTQWGGGLWARGVGCRPPEGFPW